MARPWKGPAGLGRDNSVPVPALMCVQQSPALDFGPTGALWAPCGLRRGCDGLGQIFLPGLFSVGFG